LFRTAYLYHPYCGFPPSPSSVWSHWNLDPGLIAILATVAIAYKYSSPCDRNVSRIEHRSFYVGWVIVSGALISPLCSMSVALFSARIAQHMILLLIGAPLVALGRPAQVFASATMLRTRRERAFKSYPLAATALFGALLWYWHAPNPYAATFKNDLTYWAMHLTLFGSALWLWSELLNKNFDALIRIGFAAALSSVQMGLLGALITFAPRALYDPHLLTTAAWNLTPLQDQQLGGVVMWVPGCTVFLAAAIYAFWLVMENMDIADLRSSRASG
jgi:putative membrane protein